MKNTCFPSRTAVVWFLVLSAVLGGGCGLIADKDLIVIATINGEKVTRGDFEKVLRNMSPDERPIITTKGDVRKALQNYLDTTMKDLLAEKYKAEGKLHVDRALAEQVYTAKHPDEMARMTNPKDYDLTQQDLKYMEEDRQIGIDEELKKLEAEQAVYIRIGEEIKNGTMQVSDQEYQEEYDLRKDDLKHPEKIAIEGIVIPGSDKNTVDAAGVIRNRLATGTPVEDIAREFQGQGAIVLKSGLENDSSNPKYAGFWQQASGAEPGTILGPIFVHEWQMVVRNAQGNPEAHTIPDGLLVCKVTNHEPPTPMTLEEAKPVLAQSILYGKVMDQLRKEYKVQVFENKLPDPSMYDTRQSIIIQNQPKIQQ